MTVTVKTRTDLTVPKSIRRKAGYLPGDQVEFRVSGRTITIVPKLTPDETEDEREIRDPKVRAMIRQSHQDFLAGKTRPAEMLQRELVRIAENTSRGRKIRFPPAPEGMTSGFTVRTNSRYDRLAKTLQRRHPEFMTPSLGASDPWRGSVQPIPITPHQENWRACLKAMGRIGSPSGGGDFDTNTFGTVVLLSYCGLRRESTY